MLGVLGQLATIGVTKKHLYGTVCTSSLRYGRPEPVTDPDRGDALGYALLPTVKSRRPIYVSPGQGVSVDGAARIVQQWMGRWRLPAPIYWADRLSRDAVARQAADSASAGSARP